MTLALALAGGSATVRGAPSAAVAPTPASPPMTRIPATLAVEPVFGADDQRDRIAQRFADAPSRRFLEHAIAGRLEALREQVRGGYAINTTGTDGMTPLIAYVSYVRPVRSDVLLLMLALGADVTQPMRNGMSLLNGLSRVQDAGVLAVLLQGGVSPDTRLAAGRESWLTVAVQENHTALALGLLAAGAKPNPEPVEAASTASTPLQMAAALGNWIVADALIRAGADPRQGDAELKRLAHALATRPPTATSPQGQAHAAVARWLASQGRPPPGKLH
jgi:uncharacterized protein